jgi:hypothetical protein
MKSCKINSRGTQSEKYGKCFLSIRDMRANQKQENIFGKISKTQTFFYIFRHFDSFSQFSDSKPPKT